jgi:hypothetical protein
MAQPTPEQAAQLATLAALASRPQLPGSKALLLEAWSLFRANVWRLLGISLLGLLPMFLVPVVFITGMAAGATDATMVIAGVLVAVALVGVVWSSAASLLVLLRPDAATGVLPAFSAARPYILPFIWVALLQTALGFGGLFLFLIGSILFSLWVSFAPLVLLDENIHGMRAIVKSRELLRGRTWRMAGYFFILGFVFWVASLVFSGIPMLLGAPKDAAEFFNGIFGVLAGPFAACFQVALYRHVKATSGDIGVSPKPGQLKWYWIVALLGPIMMAFALSGMIAAYKVQSQFYKEMGVGLDGANPTMDQLNAL